MASTKIKLIASELRRGLNKNSPSILVGLGIAGFVSSIVMAVKATPKAMKLLEEANIILYRTEFDSKEKAPSFEEFTIFYGINSREKVEITWKCYVPTAGMALLATTCILMSNRIHLRRTAAVASLYAIAESTLREYQDKVVEEIGKKKEAVIRGDIAQKKLDDNPVDEDKVVATGRGDMLCYEPLTGRYFRSDIETIRKIQNDFNEQLLSDMTLTLNELYFELVLKPTTLGAKVGWDIDKGMVEFEFNSMIASTGEPCIVLDHKNPPQALWF